MARNGDAARMHPTIAARDSFSSHLKVRVDGHPKSAAVLTPVAIAATFLGVWLVKRFDPRTFYGLIYATILLVGVYLIAASLYEII